MLVAGAAWAEPGAERVGRIGFFKLTAVYERSGVQTWARRQWRQRLAEREEALKRLASDLEALQVQVRLEAGRLTAEERQARDEAIARTLEELSRAKAQYQDELLQFEQTVQARVAEIIAQAAAEVGRARGYAAILEKEKSLYYLSSELDVTDAIADEVRKTIDASSAGSPGDPAAASPSSR